MIFYFSGNMPFTRREWPDDADMQFFKKNSDSFDRLISLVYEKGANLVIDNLKKMEAENGESEQGSSSGLPDESKPRRRRKGK